jgi:hypothetical protein
LTPETVSYTTDNTVQYGMKIDLSNGLISAKGKSKQMMLIAADGSDYPI